MDGIPPRTPARRIHPALSVQLRRTARDQSTYQTPAFAVPIHRSLLHTLFIGARSVPPALSARTSQVCQSYPIPSPRAPNSKLGPPPAQRQHYDYEWHQLQQLNGDHIDSARDQPHPGAYLEHTARPYNLQIGGAAQTPARRRRRRRICNSHGSSCLTLPAAPPSRAASKHPRRAELAGPASAGRISRRHPRPVHLSTSRSQLWARKHGAGAPQQRTSKQRNDGMRDPRRGLGGHEGAGDESTAAPNTTCKEKNLGDLGNIGAHRASVTPRIVRIVGPWTPQRATHLPGPPAAQRRHREPRGRYPYGRRSIARNETTAHDVARTTAARQTPGHWIWGREQRSATRGRDTTYDEEGDLPRDGRQ
ncbi:hypothetical protein BJ912DRAFT_363697 [Pholiota molesta]|nr:hypothetical protein BJ912DRAFT_363697 [Pholiota molesta]